MQKTDNHNLRQKVDLRRMLCGAITEPLRVLDLYSGAGKIWSEMRKTFKVASYTPVDEKAAAAGMHQNESRCTHRARIQSEAV
jgi:hypothetical protein